MRLRNRCLRWCLSGKAKVDLDFFYLVFVDSEQFHVSGSASILDFAVVEDEGFVGFFKQLLNAMARRRRRKTILVKLSGA